jgi:hypothetical protein
MLAAAEHAAEEAEAEEDDEGEAEVVEDAD